MQHSLRIAALVTIEFVFLCGPLAGEMREGEIPEKFQGILLYAPYPRYPVDLVRRGIRGHGLFRVSFDSKTGGVTDVKVLNSTGFVILNELAAKALLQWKARPGAISSLRVPITFQPAGFTRVVH